MTTELTIGLACNSCGRECARVSEEEFDGMGAGGFWGGLCFDCDPESASTVPSLFWQWQVGDVFVLDDRSLEVVGNSDFPDFLIDVSHTHERTGARSCLSSSTYLNTQPNQNREWEPEAENYAKCPQCEVGDIFLSEKGWLCDTCDFLGVPSEELVIPAWIVSSAVPAGKSYSQQKGCPDCDTVRLLGGGGYCSYHSDFLDDNQREYLYGYGNGK